MRIKPFILQLSLLAGLNLSVHSHVMADTLQDAEQAIAKKEYSTAIIHLKNQLKENSENAQARYLLGDVYLRTGKLDSAIKELDRAHRYAPENNKILFRYAEALQAAGKYKKILQFLSKPLTDKAQESQRLSYLGNAHLGLKQLADAKQAFDEANRLEKSIAAYNGLTKLALLEKDLPLAEEQLSYSLSLDPDNASTLQLKARLANQNQQRDQALLLYNQLIEKNSSNLSLRLERAMTLAVLKKDDEAKADLTVILNKVENHPQANFILAQILLREQDYAGAQAAAQRVVNVAPQHMPAALILGAASFGLKQYNQAVEYLIIYLSADPSNLKVQNLLANVYLAQKKIRQALLILEGIPEQQRNNDPMVLLTLGSAYLLKGDTKKGIAALNLAQSLAPDNLDIKKRLIAAQFQSGDLEDAISELEQLSTSEQSQNQTNYLLIISYIKKKQFLKADEKVNQLLLQTPDDSKLLNLKALIEQLRGNTDKAIAQYQSILKTDKDNIPAYMGLARIAAINSQWPEAEQYFRQVLRINPDTLKAYLGLVAIAEKQGNSQLAEQHFLDAIEQSKSNPSAQLSVAELLSQWYSTKQQPEKLLALAELLEKQQPNDNNVRSFLARAQLLNKQNKQAERTLKNIITFDKYDVKHRVLLAQTILQESGRSDEALLLLRDAQAVTPDNPTPYTLEVVILINLTRYEEAISVAKSLQQQFPDSVTGKLLEADIYRAQKQYKKALPIYQQVYQQQPDRKVLSATIDTLLALKQYDEAIILLTKVIEEDPEDLDSLFKLASLHHEKQQFKEAEQYYQQLLKLSPNHTVSLNNLAWIYLDSDLKLAVDMARRAHEQAPQSAAVTDTYGYFLVRDGQFQKGLSMLKQAALAIPEDKDIQYHLALAYDKTGQQSRARTILENIVNSETPYSEQENAEQLLLKLNE